MRAPVRTSSGTRSIAKTVTSRRSDKSAPSWKFREFEDGLTNTITGATDSALDA